MIARIWKGRTKKIHADAYAQFLEKVAAPDYQSVAGNKGITFLKKIENDEAHFTLITYWDSLESIKKFAGRDYERAKYYPEDKDYLLAFEEKVEHHEIFLNETI